MPLYNDIEQDLVRKIESGQFTPDAALPTELELCELYGVSRITVRRAVERLVAARMIYRRRGVGTFVNRREDDGKSLQLIGHMNDVLTFQQQLSAQIFERGLKTPPPHVRDAFGVDGSVELYAIAALNSLDGKPYAITESYFAKELADIAPKVTMRGGKTSLRYVEELAGIRARSGRQTIEATLARGSIARRLGVKSGAAILAATRSFFADGPHPIEVVVVHYHPTRYRVLVELVTADSFTGSASANGR
jgi:GntR family transcriptional regulator